MDAVIRVRGLEKILALLQSQNEEVLLKSLEMIWVTADTEIIVQRKKYQNAIRQADKKNLVSAFAIIPKLLLHYEERIALNANGAMCAMSAKNSK